ncbi:MAG: high frequency lysogenization protein HflD [Dokdonella sp.]
MRESRVIALAGVFQACNLVREMANTGRIEDSAALETSLASIFRIDADSPVDVFGGLANLRPGLGVLVDQLDGTKQRDLMLTQLVVAVVRLQKRLARRNDMLTTLREGIEAAQRQVDHFGINSANTIDRLATLYGETLSQLRPRITVHGDPEYLHDQVRVAKIRALLLAAVRAAVLWRQVGGSQWRMLLRRREYSLLARGLLTRCTLDRG